MSLPIGYKRLEYIQSSGTQYVDTGFVCNGNSKIEAEFEVLDASNGGAYLYGGGSGSARIEAYPWSGTMEMNYGSLAPFVGSIVANKKFYICQDKGNFHFSYPDGSGSWTQEGETQSFNCVVPMAIFVLNRGAIYYPVGGMRLYWFKIYDNGTLVRYFIPHQTASGDIGLWDDVNSVFYGNAGTGTFTAGPVAPVIPEAPPNLQQAMSIRLIWAEVSGAWRYNIYRDGTLLGSITETAYIDLTAAENTEYTYAVSAVNSAGESPKTTISVYTKTGYFLCKPIIQSATFQ